MFAEQVVLLPWHSSLLSKAIFEKFNMEEVVQGLQELSNLLQIQVGILLPAFTFLFQTRVFKDCSKCSLSQTLPAVLLLCFPCFLSPHLFGPLLCCPVSSVGRRCLLHECSCGVWHSGASLSAAVAHSVRSVLASFLPMKTMQRSRLC